MAYRLRVNFGGSVLGPNNIIYRGGEIIPDGLLSAKQIQEHINSGYVSPVNESAAMPLPDRLTETPPGVEEKPAIKSGSDDRRVSKPEEVVTTSSGGVVSKTTKKKIGRPAVSIWNLDPAELSGKDIDDLNVMILERDDSIDPFETTEEAVAFLSKDFGK
jgi:hypothetical protein